MSKTKRNKKFSIVSALASDTTTKFVRVNIIDYSIDSDPRCFTINSTDEIRRMFYTHKSKFILFLEEDDSGNIIIEDDRNIDGDIILEVKIDSSICEFDHNSICINYRSVQLHGISSYDEVMKNYFKTCSRKNKIDNILSRS